MPSSPSSPPPSARRGPPSWADDDRATRDAADGLAVGSILLEEGALLARKYRLTRTAGFGGMAQLWVATNEATGAEVCIKILVPEKSDDESVERFRREAYAAARLSHRAIVRIFDLVELGLNGEVITSGKPAALAIVMELLHGETLGDFLMKRGKLTLDEAIDLTLPFLSALAHAHRAGVVHRDLKPDNIFLASDPDGHVIPKVLDFGVSKIFGTGELGSRTSDAKPLTFDGVMLGTPSYMSPEQARGSRNVDARSDVFSAGILFYMMLAGRNPFESETFHSVISAILEREPPRLVSVPDAIWEVIEKALAKNAGERFADATELGIALRRASGRTSTTESGPQSAGAIPVSARVVVPPLGGDSHVTVPPADDADEMPGPRAPPAARRRAVRIVVAVVAASVALTVVALLRKPSDSTSAARPGESAPIGRPASAAPPPATTTATTTATAATTATPTATAPKPAVEPPASVDAGHAGVVVPPGIATTPPAVPSVPRSRPPGEKKPPASPVSPGVPSPNKEPAIVRDPGF